MKFLSATLASVVGAASADPAIIAMPAAVQPQMQPATTFLTAGAQPVYVATQPRLVAAAGAQPALLEQQVMRTPQMATVPHLYNVHHPQVPQVVAAPAVLRQQIIPAVAPQQYVNAETIKVVEQQPRAGEEVSQQYHSQDEFGNYSYGYANNNSEKQEVGNTRSGQVKGHYTYVDGAGRNRRVDYVADNNGFRAAGDGINKIKREAEAEPEAEPEAKAEAEPEADPKMVQMTSYVNNNGKQEGIKMSSYMTDNTMQQQQPSMRMSSMMRPSSIMMTYTNDMSSSAMSNPMVYMSMNAPGGATLTASRMTNNNNMYNMQRNHQMDNMRMDNMRMMDSMRMDNMGMDNMRMDRNDVMMRRNNMLNMGRSDMRMNTMGMNNRDMYRMMNHRAGLRGQQQQQYLNNMHRGRDMLMRDSMFKTNPSNNFMEIQQFEMKPNYNYRFDF